VDPNDPTDRTLFGASVTDNILQGPRMGYGFAVDGVRDWTVTGNKDLSTHSGTPIPACNGQAPLCPRGLPEIRGAGAGDVPGRVRQGDPRGRPRKHHRLGVPREPERRRAGHVLDRGAGEDVTLWAGLLAPLDTEVPMSRLFTAGLLPLLLAPSLSVAQTPDSLVRGQRVRVVAQCTVASNLALDCRAGHPPWTY